MKQIILCSNPYRDRKMAAALQAAELLRAEGIETRFCLPFPVEKDSGVLPPGVALQPLAGALRSAGMLICFGGDGTILRVAKDAARHGIPVLGINLGGVGFMAELESSEMPLLSHIAREEYRTEERMMLHVAVTREGKAVFRDTALNDAVITKGAVARIVDLSVFSDDVQIYTLAGDGVIVCTPTGSTAYSMSAGGPIVEPTAENIIVTPICAHALHAKSFVLARDRVVRVKTGRLMNKTAYLSVDGGRAFRLHTGDEVTIRRSMYKTKLVCLTDKTFFTILKGKFNRQGDPE